MEQSEGVCCPLGILGLVTKGHHQIPANQSLLEGNSHSSKIRGPDLRDSAVALQRTGIIDLNSRNTLVIEG